MFLTRWRQRVLFHLFVCGTAAIFSLSFLWATGGSHCPTMHLFWQVFFRIIFFCLFLCWINRIKRSEVLELQTSLFFSFQVPLLDNSLIFSSNLIVFLIVQGWRLSGYDSISMLSTFLVVLWWKNSPDK